MKGGEKMATKGPSNHYGNSKGGSQGKANQNINYAWAKDFNKHTLHHHFDEHGKEMGYSDINSYRTAAILFANYVDRENCISKIDKGGSTFKFNKLTNEFAIIDKKGYVISYYPLNGGYKRFLTMVEKECKK